MNLYDFHYWSTVYREEKLAKTSRQHLVERARTGREPCESGRLGITWRKSLALLREA
jgi:hypothetical protein